MEIYQLVCLLTNNKQSRYHYQVIKDGQIIAERFSNRDYVACFVTVDLQLDCYQTPYFFSRLDLIGRNGSALCRPVGLAILDSHRSYAEAVLSSLKKVNL